MNVIHLLCYVAGIRTENIIVFEKLRKALESSSLLAFPRHVAYRYNHKSYEIRLKTDNWQYQANR